MKSLRGGTLPLWGRQYFNTLVCTSLGVGAFYIFDLPLPFLFGPMLGCMVFALCGLPIKGVPPAEKISRGILGAAAGSTLNPELFYNWSDIALTLSLVIFYVTAIGLICVPLLVRFGKYDFITAYYSAMPGGLHDMVIIGMEAGGNARAMSLIHSTRILLLVVFTPIIVTYWFGGSFDLEIATPLRNFSILDLALMTVVSVLGWYVAKKLKVLGASVLGPMVAVGALSLSNVIESRPPLELILFSQVFIGISVGHNYSGITFSELRRYFVTSFLYVCVLACVAFVFIRVIIYFDLAPALDVFFAFMPGGQAEIVVLSIAVGADVGFIVVHHLLRIIYIIMCAPLFYHVIKKYVKKIPPSST